MRSRLFTGTFIRSSLVCKGWGVNSRLLIARCESHAPTLNLCSSSVTGPVRDSDFDVAEGARNDRDFVLEDVLRLAVRGFPDHALVTLDPQGVITFWNVGAEQLLGWRSEQAVHVHVSSVLGPGGPDCGIGSNDLADAERQGSMTVTRRLNHQDGSTRDARTTILALRDDTGVLGYGVAAHLPTIAPSPPVLRVVGRELDDPTAAETRRQLAESRMLLAAEIADRTQAETSRARLLRRLVVAQEDERRRLARDLHDGLGQRLTALRLILEALDGDRGGPGEQPTGTANALEMLARIDQEVDFIAWELRPAALDELGLARVLDSYVKEWSRHAGVPAVFHARPGNLQRFAPEVESSIYRIAQESLNNIAKHARAHLVNVLLELRGESLALVVEDDGVGCQSTARGETMIGLTGMRERALAVGGTLELEPTPGGGTTVLACIPTTGRQLQRLGAAGHLGASEDAESPPADRGGESPDASGATLSAIRTRLQELQRAVAARDEFIATVAHELRNPIAPLTFQVRLALNKTEQFAAADTPVSVEWIQTQLRGMERRLHRLLETLDRLLDVSRISTGRIDLQAEPMDLAEVVREVIDAFDAEFAVARCTVTLSVQGTATGAWDRLRVEQVCRNLLSNAIRFGAGRPIEVAVDADHDFARVAVRDHGVGIAADHQSKIFERFERGVEQRTGGFGIGLWIVKNICVAMGGTVSVDSSLGEGACFTVMLPRRPARQPVEADRSDVN
jgi:signal transduction histidine kinase